MSGLFSDGSMPLFQTPKTAGQDANISGQLCERSLREAFIVRRVPVVPWRPQAADLFYDQVLLTNVPYTSIYGSESRSEFVYRQHSAAISVRIECRSQQSGGSVDEKFPFLFANACKVKENAVWIVLNGDGARKNAVEWLKSSALRHEEKTIRVYSENEARRAIKHLVEEGVTNRTFEQPNRRRLKF
jgi:hypothetical protein